MAVKLVAVPTQIVVEDAFAAIVGIGFTVTLAVAVHPFKLPVTVYNVEEAGDATGFAITALLSPLLGDQV